MGGKDFGLVDQAELHEVTGMDPDGTASNAGNLGGDVLIGHPDTRMGLQDAGDEDLMAGDFGVFHGEPPDKLSPDYTRACQTVPDYTNRGMVMFDDTLYVFLIAYLLLLTLLWLVGLIAGPAPHTIGF
jgi:hypothetical protein